MGSIIAPNADQIDVLGAPWRRFVPSGGGYGVCEVAGSWRSPLVSLCGFSSVLR